MFLKLDSLIRENLAIEPSYDQKNYVSYQISNYNWLEVRTFANVLALRFLIKKNSMEQTIIATNLGVKEFDTDDSVSEKLNLPSSVNIKNRNETADRILLRIKDDFDIAKPALLNFLKDTIKNSPRA